MALLPGTDAQYINKTIVWLFSVNFFFCQDIEESSSDSDDEPLPELES